jgi:hypothetical protein
MSGYTQQKVTGSASTLSSGEGVSVAPVSLSEAPPPGVRSEKHASASEEASQANLRILRV